MKIIHQNGYTVDELSLYRLTIYKNLLDCIKALITAMGQFDLEPSTPANREYAEFLFEYNLDADPKTTLDMKVGDAVVEIWKDASVAKVLEHQNEFYLMDSAP